jgi:hypothetical protein
METTNKPEMTTNTPTSVKSEEQATALLNFLNWYSSLTPSDKVSVWSKDGQWKGLFNKDNEQMVESYFDHLRREERRKNTTTNENGE